MWFLHNNVLRSVYFKVMLKKPSDTFLYFAYGSNLLTERIHINNPSAKKKAVAKLKDYRLDFNYFSKRWGGSAATIVPTPGQEVWGVLWELENIHLETLDKQEGVAVGIYRRLNVKVNTGEGEEYDSYTYEMMQPWEEERRPSWIYKEVIVRGAIENGLPDHYLTKLRAIEDNGYKGDVKVKLDFLENS